MTKVSRALNVVLAALVGLFSLLGVVMPMAMASTVCGGVVTPAALSTNVSPGGTVVQTWGFTWTGVTPSQTINIGIVSSDGAWGAAVLPTTVNSGPGSGSTTLQVTVIAPNSISSTQITVTVNNVNCAIADFASGSAIFTTTPEFGLPAMAVTTVAFLGLVLIRRRTVTLKN